MNWTMAKAWVVGALILVFAHALWWGVAAGIQHAEFLRVVLFLVPILAAFLVTYLSPERKVVLGLSMGILGAIVGILSIAAYQQLGYHVDEIGGPVATFAILLVVHLGYAVTGTCLGYLAWRLRSRSVSRV